MKKKLFSLAVTLVMALSLAVPAMAAGNGSITVNNAVNGKTYAIYRIFDLKQVADSGTSAETAKVSYTIADKWTGFFKGDEEGVDYIAEDQCTLKNQIVVDGVTKWINITEENVGAFAQDALDYALKNVIADDGHQVASGTTVQFTGLDLGYYMVYPEGATDITGGNSSICSLTSTIPAATVVPKADYPTIDKEVNDADVEYGQTVTYTITGQVPDTTGYTEYTYKVKDNMTGLTLTGTYDVKIDGVSIKESGHVTGTVPTDGGTSFEMSIDVTEYQAENIGDEIVITYDATVTAEATIGPDGNTNNAILIYSTDPDTTTEATPETVKVYTCQITIDKVDGNEKSKKLDGAEFALKNSDGKYYKLTDGVVSWVTIAEPTYANITANATTVTTGNGSWGDGYAEFKGLQAGEYQLVEIKAPEGYNLLTTPKNVTIEASGDSAHTTVVAQVENNTGAVLPGTGGMGTTIFYAVGGTLVAAAAVLLITKKRMHNVED